MDRGMTRRAVAAGIGALGLLAGQGSRAAVAQADAPRLEVGGLVDAPRSYTFEQLADLPAVDVTLGVPKGDDRPTTARGPLLYDLLMASKPRLSGEDGGRLVVLASAADGFMASVAWAEIDPALQGQQVVVAVEQDGEPLRDDVRPAYLFVPDDKAGFRAVFLLTRLEVVDPAAWVGSMATPHP